MVFSGQLDLGLLLLSQYRNDLKTSIMGRLGENCTRGRPSPNSNNGWAIVSGVNLSSSYLWNARATVVTSV
jgi:hypothetical protein